MCLGQLRFPPPPYSPWGPRGQMAWRACLRRPVTALQADEDEDEDEDTKMFCPYGYKTVNMCLPLLEVMCDEPIMLLSATPVLGKHPGCQIDQICSLLCIWWWPDGKPPRPWLPKESFEAVPRLGDCLGELWGVVWVWLWVLTAMVPLGCCFGLGRVHTGPIRRCWRGGWASRLFPGSCRMGNS